MDLTEMISLALRVVQDWRMIFIAVAVLASIAILRYVGLVYHKRPKRPARPSAPGPASAGGQGGARRGGGRASRAAAEEEGDLVD